MWFPHEKMPNASDVDYADLCIGDLVKCIILSKMLVVVDKFFIREVMPEKLYCIASLSRALKDGLLSKITPRSTSIIVIQIIAYGW